MAPDTEYELIYWAAIPGRAEYIRLLFEATSTPFTDSSKDPSKYTSHLALMDPSNVGDASNPPIFAPPVLRHRDLMLSQSTNIALYLAPRLGLSGGMEAGDAGMLHLNAIALTAIDFTLEVHNTHHPISAMLYYEDQKAEAKRFAREFRTGRMPKQLTYFERLFKAKTSGKEPWVYGDSLTYADLFIFQYLHGTKFAFPKTMDKLEASGDYDHVFKHFDAVMEYPSIKAYMASDRRLPYTEGVWRHYPELEED